VERGHDQPSETLARSSGGAGARDALSEVLHCVRLTGAAFFLLDASAPWVTEVPAAPRFGRILLPAAQQIISYHIVTQGPCWGALVGSTPVRLETGDILLIPRGDAYWMASTPGLPAAAADEEARAFFSALASGHLGPCVTAGGGGPEHTHLICGFLGCDGHPFNPLLAALPPLVHLKRERGSAGEGLDALIGLALAESREPRSGGRSVLLRLSELMFVEVVRRYVAALPASETGWLAALREPEIGRALALLHAQPAEPWTLEALARAAGLSRTTFAERFTALTGQPPMQYLACWRMQLATRKLADGMAKVHAVALEVGYDSEAAFSRAFKKILGMPPSAWRRRAREAERQAI
jgi:AraC-like DNA-binding protein